MAQSLAKTKRESNIGLAERTYLLREISADLREMKSFVIE